MADPITLAALISQATDIAKAAGKNVSNNLKKNSATSLTAYTKGANIMSRLYIEDSILRDDICPPLVGVLNQLYVSYILTALNLDTMCANGRTVREQFEVVSTENVNVVKDIIENFGKYNVSPSFESGPVVESEPATQRLPVTRIIELTMQGAQVLTEQTTSEQGGRTTTTTHGASKTHTTRGDVETNTTSPRTTTREEYDKDGNVRSSTTTTESKSTKTQQLSEDTSTTDKHQDVSFTGGSSSSSTTRSESTYQFKAYLIVQLIPYCLKPEVVDGYIGAHFSPPVSSRWRQYKAGEISFWKDFVFSMDLIKKQSKALKKDKHGILSEMLMKQKSALAKFWLKMFGKGTPSHNMANTMLIVNKATFDRACRTNHINFADNNQRQKFFNKTWSMIICVVDPLYNTVDMYYNGLDVKGTYTFAMINKVGAKGQDSFDLKDVMTSFAQGMSPRF